MESEGLDNPNYGKVDCGPLRCNPTSTRRDYDVPMCINSELPVQKQLPSGQPTEHAYTPQQNLMAMNDHGSNTCSGIYSYVLVRHPEISDCDTSYDSHFLQSSREESWDLPRVVAAESGADGKLLANYTLI